MPIDFRNAFLRWLGYFLSGEFTLFIGYLWAAFDDRRQAFHDKLCGTLVVRSDAALPADLAEPVPAVTAAPGTAPAEPAIPGSPAPGPGPPAPPEPEPPPTPGTAAPPGY